MFRTLSRILRNNHIIRILAICQIIIVASSCLIFASTQDVNGMTQTVYNFTLWSDYTTNVQAYYGSQTASFSDTTLTTIARWLQQIKYYYADQTHTLYMYVPSTNTIQSVTGRHIPEIISYLNYNISQEAKINYESELLLSRLVTQMGGTNGSYVQDIALDIDAYLPSLTELTNLNSIQWNNTNQLVKVTRPDGSTITQYTTELNYPYLDFHFGSFLVPGNNLFQVELPIGSWYISNSNTFIKSVSVLSNTTDLKPQFINVDYMRNGGVVSISFSNVVAENRDLTLRVYLNNSAYITSQLPYMKYLNSSSEDYYKVANTILLRQLNSKEFTADISGDVNVDTTNLENKIDDVIDAIEDVSLVDNSVKLNLNINNNTGSDGSNIIGRLQNFFNNGTSISDFFDNVDDAESGWFTQTNSDLINTLSGGYVNLYE